MAWTYEWEIDRLKVKDEVNNDGVTLQNAVCQTFWKVTGTNDDGVSASFSGATPLSAAGVGEADFADFADLTEDQVVGWVRNIVEHPTTGYMDHINEVLAKEIGQQSETEHDKEHLPWSPEPDANTTPTPTPEEATGSE